MNKDIIKLENFKKKIYAIGVIDDITTSKKEKTSEEKKEIA
jgi:hypothetical protein